MIEAAPMPDATPNRQQSHQMQQSTLADTNQQMQADRRLQLITEVGELLAATLDFDDTLTNIAHLVVDNLADVCVINFIDDDGIARRAKVFCRDIAMDWACKALMRMPQGREQARIAQSVLELRKPILIAEVTPDLVRSWAASDEHLAALEALDVKSAIITPLQVHGRLLGALTLLSTSTSRHYGTEELRTAVAISDRCSCFLEHARLYRQCKCAERKLRLIADVGDVLATSLEFEDTLTNIALLVITELADFCVLKFVDDDGALRRARTFSRDPTKAWICDSIMRLPPGEHSRIERSALDTRKATLTTECGPEVLRSWAINDEQLTALQAIAPKSAIVAPLLVHGQLLGTLVLFSTSRPYGHDDLRVAEAIAGRSAFFLQNARLFRDSQEAMRVRDDVLRIVAHDLRNPIAAIIASTAALRMQNGKGTGSLRNQNGKNDVINEIDMSANRMSCLIQDILDVTRLRTGRLPLKLDCVDAAEIISDVQMEERPLAKAASIEIRLNREPELPAILADRHRLLQVFENLLGNAIKFTEPAGKITLTASTHDNEVLFSVADNGRGISQDQLPHVFELFWQASGRADQGTGMGLAIAKGIVEAHGGRIWVASTPGKGTTFFFTIPEVPEQWKRDPILRRPPKSLTLRKSAHRIAGQNRSLQ
jgi:signal transduction histidine kinase